MIPTVIQGAAVAFFFVPLVALTLSGLAPEQNATATGLTNFARISAGSFGTAIATTVWDNRASLHHERLIESITPYDPTSTQAFANIQALGLNAEQARGLINQMVDQQAYTMAATDVFNASAALFLVLIAVVWLARPRRGGATAGAPTAH